MAAPYRNRIEAGRRLAAELRGYSGRDVIVLALPRGGVPVAYEIARALHAPLDVFIVRKLGVPSHPELAMGAIAWGGVRVIDRAAMGHFGVTEGSSRPSRPPRSASSSGGSAATAIDAPRRT
jgi:putative phosphoribosyl transferase